VVWGDDIWKEGTTHPHSIPSRNNSPQVSDGISILGVSEVVLRDHTALDKPGVLVAVKQCCVQGFAANVVVVDVDPVRRVFPERLLGRDALVIERLVELELLLDVGHLLV